MAITVVAHKLYTVNRGQAARFYTNLVLLTLLGLFLSDEDKNGKGATTDSVQQRRQYRRQNRESSSGGIFEF